MFELDDYIRGCDASDPIIRAATIAPLKRYRASDSYGHKTLDALSLALSSLIEDALRKLTDSEVFPEYAQRTDTAEALERTAAWFSSRLLYLDADDTKAEAQKSGNAVSDGEAFWLRDSKHVGLTMYPVDQVAQVAVDAFQAAERLACEPGAIFGDAWCRGFLSSIDYTMCVDRAAVGQELARLLTVTRVLDGHGLARAVEEAMAFLEGTSKAGEAMQRAYVESRTGIWIPPLSAEKIQEAISYGLHTYGTSARMQSIESLDPFEVRLEQLGIQVTLGTAFSRIAAYAGQTSRTGVQIDPSEIEEINLYAPFRSHFTIRMLSKHPQLSLMTVSGFKREQMVDASVAQRDGYYIQSCWFPYPQDLACVQEFEIGIPRFLGFKTHRFSCELSDIH